MPTLQLPTAAGRIEAYQTRGARPLPTRKLDSQPFNRVALAAAHVVADPLAELGLQRGVS